MKIVKRIAAALLTLCLVAGCTGCGNSAAGAVAEEGNVTEEQTSPSAMGRYVEEKNNLEELNISASNMVRLKDGSLAVWDCFGDYRGVYISKDMGKTWDNKDCAWLTEMLDKNFINKMTMSQEQEMAVIYDDEADGDYNPKYMYLDSEGNQKPFEIPYNKNSDGKPSYIYNFYFSDDGRLFGMSLDSCVYEISKEDFSAQKLFEMDGMVLYADFEDNLMICANNKKILLYNIDRRESIGELEEIEEFLKTNIGEELFYTDSNEVLIKISKDKKSVYIACPKGLYRYILEGSVIEQIIEGSLSNFSNPFCYLANMELLENDEFLVLFTGNLLIRYSYDPSIPTVPDKVLSVYSLLKNDTLSQAVGIYQNKHPDIYVKYEIGMDNNDAVVKDDAVKNLNTEIMSGKGPDVILLDGLPVSSYIEKGVLLDLQPYLQEKNDNGELFRNIADTFKKEEAVYAVPLRFWIPVVVGNKKYVDGIQDLKSLADAVVSLREENREGSIIGASIPGDVFNYLNMICSPALYDQERNLDEDALREYLNQAKRIYDAEMEGVIAGEEGKMQANEEIEISHQNTGLNVTDFMMGDLKLSLGYMKDNDFNGLQLLYSMKKLDDRSDFKSCNGLAQNIYMPKSIAAINSQSVQKDMAVDFLNTLLSEENLEMNTMEGFPINRAAFDKCFVSEKEGGEKTGAGMTISKSNGEYFTIEYYWPDEEEINRVKEIVNAAETPYLKDQTVEDVITETGSKVLEGEMGVDEGVNEIINKLSVYLAE